MNKILLIILFFLLNFSNSKAHYPSSNKVVLENGKVIYKEHDIEGNWKSSSGLFYIIEKFGDNFKYRASTNYNWYTLVKINENNFETASGDIVIKVTSSKKIEVTDKIQSKIFIWEKVNLLPSDVEKKELEENKGSELTIAQYEKKKQGNTNKKDLKKSFVLYSPSNSAYYGLYIGYLKSKSFGAYIGVRTALFSEINIGSSDKIECDFGGKESDGEHAINTENGKTYELVPNFEEYGRFSITIGVTKELVPDLFYGYVGFGYGVRSVYHYYYIIDNSSLSYTDGTWTHHKSDDIVGLESELGIIFNYKKIAFSIGTNALTGLTSNNKNTTLGFSVGIGIAL